MNSQHDLEENMNVAERYIRMAAVDENTDFVVLPEYFAFIHDDPKKMHESAEAFPGKIYGRLSALARELNLVVHAGSVVERNEGRFFNTSLVFGRDGSELARYRKIHLFDVDNPNGTAHRESNVVSRGTDIVTYKVDDLTFGCSICYDLRFPELFRKLRDRGADVIVLPAAFTLTTGKNHWEVLVRARAIETQTYMLAAGQINSYAEGRRASWGHSMIVDPWGTIVAQASDGAGLISARVDPHYSTSIRRSIPVAEHHVLA